MGTILITIEEDSRFVDKPSSNVLAVLCFHNCVMILSVHIYISATSLQE